ncbi:MAG: OmpA family protein [Natronospirillum sp.]
MRRSVRTYSPQSHQWLLSYANFTTVLVALFAFLFVTMDVDTERLGALSGTVKTVLGSLEQPNVHRAAPERESMVGELRSLPAPEVETEPLAEDIGTSSVDETLRRIEAGLLQQMVSERDAGNLSIVRSSGWVMLSLASDQLFAPGDINLRVQGEDVLYVVLQVLLNESVVINVGAHTDDQMASAEASWQLSSRRAASVARYLQREGIAPQRLTAQGYGQFQPQRPNDTAEQRARNRRIEILISNPLGH